MSPSSEPLPLWKIATIMGVILALSIGLFSYCGIREAQQNMRAQHLEDRTLELGEHLRTQLNQLDLKRPTERSGAFVRGDDLIDINTDPHRSWTHYNRGVLDPEGALTPQDAALTLADQLLTEGWLIGDEGVLPGDIGLIHNDDLGSWTIVITYQTEPPPLAQWVSYDIYSPRLSDDSHYPPGPYPEILDTLVGDYAARPSVAA